MYLIINVYKKGAHQFTFNIRTIKILTKPIFRFSMTFRMTSCNIVKWNSIKRHPTNVCECASMFVLISCLYISRECILILVRACTCIMRNLDFAFTLIYLAFYYSYCRDQRDANIILQCITNVFLHEKRGNTDILVD